MEWYTLIVYSPGLFDRLSRCIVGMPVEREYSIMDDHISERIPHINRKESSIDHLVKIGFARCSGKNILLAILDIHASPREIISTIDIINTIEHGLSES
ncbi:MAG: hypothetical protein PVG65_03760 [Candidatus Thorarchaeota archaeon]